MNAKSRKTTVYAMADAWDNAGKEFGSVEEVFDHMEQGVVVWSRQMVCELVNRRYYELVDLTEEQLRPGINIDEYYSALEALGRLGENEVESSVEVFKENSEFNFERKMPAGRTLSFVGRPLKTGGVVVTITDITESRKRADKLSESVLRAESAEANMAASLAIQKKQRQEAHQLNEFGDWLHSCESLAEVFSVVKQSLEQVYRGTSGELYIFRNSRDGLELGTSWGSSDTPTVIRPDDCWALRRGRTVSFGEGMINLDCAHLNHANADKQSKKPTHSVCLPIVAHGNTVGLLHMDLSSVVALDQQDDVFSQDFLALASRYAEHISIAVANVKLREELHRQSTLDSLTGLYNRRHFFDLASSRFSPNETSGTQIAIAIFDVDNFKLFNDKFGHDAGDRVLIELSRKARSFFDKEVLIARIGGEEFALLIPGMDVDQALELMTRFTAKLNAMTIRHGNGSLPACSISAGISMYPAHGHSLHDLVRLADSAMYDAKKSGKNRVCVCVE